MIWDMIWDIFAKKCLRSIWSISNYLEHLQMLQIVKKLSGAFYKVDTGYKKQNSANSAIECFLFYSLKSKWFEIVSMFIQNLSGDVLFLFQASASTLGEMLGD